MLLLNFFKKNKLQKFVFLSFAFLNSIFTLPNTPTVVNGVVDFAQEENSLNITCSNRSIINWNAFSIEAGERVSFIQPTREAFVLNRVTGMDPSKIFGSLNSNGVLFLLNPNGILIGQGGQIDVGSFVASTLNLSDIDFINTDAFSFLGESRTSIVNLGNIKSAKDVFLISKQIDNKNSIEAPNGKIGFGAALSVLLRPNENQSIYIFADLSDEKEDLGINNQGNLIASNIEIRADGNLYQLAIHDSSTMDATSLEESNGEIYLVAKNGNIKVDGSQIIAKKANNGGIIEVLANDIEISGNSKIDASNVGNGGVVNIGCLNEDTYSKAKEIIINENVIVNVCSKANGTGGNIKIVSDDRATVLGQIYVNPKGLEGSSGEILLESAKLNLKASIEDNEQTPYLGTLKINTAEALIQDENINDITIISPVFLNQALQNYNVEINSKNVGFINGNISINADLEWNKESFLKLTSDEIYVNGKISNSGSFKYHDSLIAFAKRIDINSNVNVGYNNIFITLDAIENNLLNVNEGLFGCVSINALGKNNSFNIKTNSNMYAMKINGGLLEDSTNILINKNYSSKWTINSDYEGNLGAISFKNINSIQGAANDDIFISAKMKEVVLKENNNATITGFIDLLTVDSNCCNIDIQEGYVKEINNINGKNIYFLNGGLVDRISCQNGNDYFYFSNGDVLDYITVDQANAYFNFTYNASIHANIYGGSKINQLNYYIYNSPINVDLNTNVATGILGSISNVNSIIGDKKYFGNIHLPNTSNICKSNGKYSGIINDSIYFSNISQIDANGDNLFEIHGHLNSIIGGNNNIYNFYSDGNVINVIQGASESNQFNFFAKAQIDGKIVGGIGQNILSYENYNQTILVDVTDKIATGINNGFENISAFVGDSDYLGKIISKIPNAEWKIDGVYSGNINDEIYFSKINDICSLEDSSFHLNENGFINNIYADNLNNIYYFNGGDVNKIFSNNGSNRLVFLNENFCNCHFQLNGAINTFDYSNYPNDVMIDFSSNKSSSCTNFCCNVNKIIGNNLAYTTTVKGSDRDTTWLIDNDHQGSLKFDSTIVAFEKITNIEGGREVNTIFLKENGKISNITTGSGINHFYMQNGDVENCIFSNGCKDEFIFENNSMITGSICDGGDCCRILNYENYGSKVVFDLQNEKVSGMGGNICCINTIIGDHQYFGEIIGPDNISSYSIQGENVVFDGRSVFKNFDAITAGKINSTFCMCPGAKINSITGDVNFYNILDYSSYDKSIFIDPLNMTGAGIEHFMNINRVNFTK